MMKMENVAVVLTGGEKGKLFEKALQEAGWIELRVDRFLEKFPKKNWLLWAEEIRKGTTAKIIGTIRWSKEQPELRLRIPESSRSAMYEKLMPFVDFVDVEVNSTIVKNVVKIAGTNNTRAILSYHDFAGTPSFDKLGEIYRKAKRLRADIIKIATSVRKSSELLRLLEFTSKYGSRNPLVVTPMNVSFVERLIPLTFGSLFTYAALNTPTAPGQPSYAEIIRCLSLRGL